MTYTNEPLNEKLRRFHTVQNEQQEQQQQQQPCGKRDRERKLQAYVGMLYVSAFQYIN